MQKFEQHKINFLRSLEAAENQSGLDLSKLKYDFLQLFEAAQPRLQSDLACAECNEYNGYHKTGCKNWLWQPSPSR